MENTRLAKIMKAMEENHVEQMIISDPASIYYLTGCWIHPGERLMTLFLNTNGKVQMILNKLFPQGDKFSFDIEYYDDIDDCVAVLAKCVEDGKTFGVDKIWPAKFLLRLMELRPGCRFVNSSVIVDHIRQIKDEKEQELMRVSSQVNDMVMEKLYRHVADGLTEQGVADILLDEYEKAGCDGVSFDPIIGYGANAADPHHATDKVTRGKRGDSVVLDIGGVKDGYCSDMTRTVFLGEASEKAREVYHVVLEANLRGIAAAKPGNRFCDVDNACRDYITEKGYGQYFTHRTGHNIGIEDHEFGDVSSVNEEVIKPGMVFSVEPGIYIPGEVGVRIEDLVLITKDGCEVLNRFTKDLLVV